eukprot:4328931-Ditylum_brightwellii.AAC.1
MHLPSMRRRISPTPTGRAPGNLLRAISLPATMALHVAQAGRVFASHRATAATASRRRQLAAPKRSSQSCQAIESTPPGPAAPCILDATL